MAPIPGPAVSSLVAVPAQGKQRARVRWCRDPEPSAGGDPRRGVWPCREACEEEGRGGGQPPEPRSQPGRASSLPISLGVHRDLLPRFPEGPLIFSGRFVCKTPVCSFTVGPTRSPATCVLLCKPPSARSCCNGSEVLPAFSWRLLSARLPSLPHASPGPPLSFTLLQMCVCATQLAVPSDRAPGLSGSQLAVTVMLQPPCGAAGL